MALPRFHRLETQRQTEILTVAREHIARDGPAAVSYNKLIAAAGISKTSAYLYFDGKEDLVAEVVKDSVARVLEALGQWQDRGQSEGFWKQLSEGSHRLRQFLLEHPQDLAILQLLYNQPELQARAGIEGQAEQWFDSLLQNGRALKIVREDIDRDLLRSATISLFRTIDAWALEQLMGGKQVDMSGGLRLIKSLWSKA